LFVVTSPSKITTGSEVFLTTLALPVALLVIENVGVLTVNFATLIAQATYFVTLSLPSKVSSVFSKVILLNKEPLMLEVNCTVGVPATFHSSLARSLTSDVLET
jgi:hypothetical protein